MQPCAVIEYIASYLPENKVENSYFADRLDTSDAWIRTRTGISTRFWAGEGECTSDLAVKAGQRLLVGMQNPPKIDLLILATTTPDHHCPATAPDVAERLGLGEIPAFDISAVCSGFIYALSVAASYLTADFASRVLVIAAETYSSIIDKSDRTTSVIFGDGAGAVLLRKGKRGEPGCVQGITLGSNGKHKSAIMVPGGGSRSRTSKDKEAWSNEFFQMNGKETFDLAVHKMTASTQKIMGDVGWQPNDVDWFVAHQANQRILKMVAASVGIPEDVVIVNIDKVGNTSAASIPLALCDAHEKDHLKEGDKVLLSAFGGGVTWGSAAILWPNLKETTQ